MTPRRAAACAAPLLLALALTACGTSNTGADGPNSHDTRGNSAHRPLPVGLEGSVEIETAAFLGREGSALRRSLRRFIGAEMTTEVERGSAVCRAGSETASIADPAKYPFACIVRASADGQGLEVGITLGFVGTELDGKCWRATNERVAVTTTAPALLSRREARRLVNQITGCA